MRYFDINPEAEIGLEDGKWPYWYRDILNTHKDELESGHLSEEVISKLIHLPHDLQQMDERHIDMIIFPIYNYLLSAKCCWGDKFGDHGIIREIIRSTTILKYVYWDQNESLIFNIAQKIYTELLPGYKKVCNPGVILYDSIYDDDIFNPIHLQDARFYFNKLEEMFPNDEKLKTILHYNLINFIY